MDKYQNVLIGDFVAHFLNINEIYIALVLEKNDKKREIFIDEIFWFNILIELFNIFAKFKIEESCIFS